MVAGYEIQPLRCWNALYQLIVVWLFQEGMEGLVSKDIIKLWSKRNKNEIQRVRLRIKVNIRNLRCCMPVENVSWMLLSEGGETRTSVRARRWRFVALVITHRAEHMGGLFYTGKWTATRRELGGQKCTASECLVVCVARRLVKKCLLFSRSYVKASRNYGKFWG